VPMVAGNFAGNDTNALVQRIKEFDFEGVTAILSASPAYVKPTQEGIYQHYGHIASNCHVPIILYNVPGRTRSNMEWDTTIRLARDFENIIAIKEASADLSQITKIIKNKPEDFLVISGDDETALATVAIGGDGVISVIANALPKTFSSMISSALKSDYKTAAELNLNCFDLHHWLYKEGNPAGIKAALKALNICSDEVRLPLTALSSKSYEEITKVLKQIKE
jgi:4-hydroxy-tetrahydrodipicolinate synthase